MGLETKISVGDIGRLLELVSELAEECGCSSSEAVERIARMLTPCRINQFRGERAKVAEVIGRIRRVRVRRNEMIGAPLFRDPAWDMLLELFVAHDSGRSLSVSSLCHASGVPPTTALRQLVRLEEHGLIERHGDRTDHRRSFVRLTAEGARRVAQIAQAMLAQIQGDGGSAFDRRPGADDAEEPPASRQ